jgi:cell division protein FtsL
MNHQSTHPHGSRQRRARGSSGQAWLANGRRRFPLLVSRIGPVTLSVCSVLLMSLMAILYLYQQGQAVTTNQQIQTLRSQQTTLQRQNDDLVNTIATEQSPEYVASFASKMGLAPASPQNVQVVNNPQAQGNGDQTNQP